MDIVHHVLVDAREYDCPIPTIMVSESMGLIEIGQILKLLTSLEGTVRNIRTFATEPRYALLKEDKENGDYAFWIQKLTD